MKIKLDENLPKRLAAVLSRLGHDLDTVMDERLSGRPDPDIRAAAQSSKRFLITQDLDFSDIRKFKPGRHHGLLLLRLKAPGRERILRRVGDVFRCEDVAGWSGCFVVVSDLKIRVLRPPSR